MRGGTPIGHVNGNVIVDYVSDVMWVHEKRYGNLLIKLIQI
jgi:hypothetical protein